MAQHIRVGTKLDCGRGATMDTTYVVERILRKESVLTLQVRTERQRCFGTAAAATFWTEGYVRKQVSADTMQVR